MTFLSDEAKTKEPPGWVNCIGCTGSDGEASGAAHATDGVRGENDPGRRLSGTIGPPEDMGHSLSNTMDDTGLGLVDGQLTYSLSNKKSGLVGAFRILFELDDDEPTSQERGLSKKSQEKRSITGHEKKWAEYIRESPDIGIITLAKYHHSENFYLMYYVKAMLLGMVLAQWLIPTVLAYKATFGYMKLEWGFCPSNAMAPVRVQTFAVGLVYVAKISFLVATKIKEMHQATLLNESRNGGVIQLFVAMDRFMMLFYEVLVYLVNLFIVYFTLDPLDIVFNVVALEFVVLLDNELKGMYLKLFPPEKNARFINKFIEANNENGTKNIRWYQFLLTKIIYRVNLWSIPFFMVFLFAFFITSIVCKPGESANK